jgi:acid stress-induced BolA-like protein IbaG/YrbA
MAIQIGRSSGDLADELRRAIEAAFPGAEVVVLPGDPGHFRIAVTSAAFAGKSRVQQQQMVYAAIGPFMRGADAAVHAIDELLTATP